MASSMPGSLGVMATADGNGHSPSKTGLWALVIGSIGVVACGIGVLFTTAYALAMQAWVVRSFEIGSPAATAA